MFLKIILLGTIFLVDYAVGNCGLCQINYVACHSENTFSLCVEGKPTDSVVRCPNGKICTDDPAICIEKNNEALTPPSCITKELSLEIDSFYETKDTVLTSYSSTLAPDSTVTDVVFDEETATIIDNSSTTELDEGNNSSSTQYSEITVDPTVAEVTDDVISTTTDEPSTTDSQEGDETTSSTEDSNASTDDTTVTTEEVSQITEDLVSTTESSELSSSSIQDVSNSDSTTTAQPSTTDSQESGEIISSTEESNTSTDDTTMTTEEVSQITEDLVSTTESSEISSSSTQDVSSSDIPSTTDINENTTSTPRDATTFCSENKDVGTFRAEGDTTCKRYYVCTTYKDGYKGYEFQCDENSYFNSEISLCQREKPDDC